MMLKRNILIVLAAATLAFAAGCASEDDQCADDECVATPHAPGTPFEEDTPSPDLCQAQCDHLDGCQVINDLECLSVCTGGGFTPAELDCLGSATCRGTETCLDLDPRNPFGD